MAIAYYGSTLSPNIDRTPEGYLICRNVPINRTGVQVYSAGELGLPGEPDRAVQVYRLEEDVFAPAALASFEGKDITRGHPPEMLTTENQAGYSKGHLENVRRDGENTVADLIIKDPALVSDVENGVLREVSCGYNCTFEPYRDGYRQTGIIGNHVAVVPRGRAGSTVAIKDATPEVEKGRNNHMSEFWKSVLTAFGMAAKDASPEELDTMVQTTASVLDAEPSGAPVGAQHSGSGGERTSKGAVQDLAGGRGKRSGLCEDDTPEAEPTEEKAAETTAEDEMVEKAPKGDDLGSKLDRILEMLEAKSRGGRGEHPLHDETDLDEMIAKLSGTEEGKAVTIPAEETDCMTGPARDAAVELLKKVRPAVAAIEDKHARAKVTDALLSAIQGPDVINGIAKAALDSAQANANQTKKTTYDQMCAESEANYAALNPHKRKEH